MHDTELVDVLNTCKYLLEEFAGLFLRNARLLHYVIEELSTAGILHDKVQLAWSLYDLIQLDYVWVSDQFKDMDLTCNSLNISHILDTTLLEDFNRHCFMCKLMNAFPHFAKCALSNLIFNEIVTDNSPLNRRSFLLHLQRLLLHL